MNNIIYLNKRSKEEHQFTQLRDEAYAEAEEMLKKKSPEERNMWQRALVVSLIKLSAGVK